jgi:DnaK suppressor protein
MIATTERRAGDQGGEPMDQDRARQLLDQERQRIRDELSHLGLAPSDELSHADLADEATDLYLEELDAGRLDDLREQLAAVERAEARLADGSYGRSVESGRPIPDERLEAVPTAERTVEEEAAWRERGG